MPRAQQDPCRLLITDVWYNWPEGRATVHVERKKGLHDFDMPNLGLRISVRLQPWRSPVMVLSSSPPCNRSTPNTALIWVVDITPSEAPRPMLQHLLLPTKWGSCMCSLLATPFVLPVFVIGCGSLCFPNWWCCKCAGDDSEWHDCACCSIFYPFYRDILQSRKEKDTKRAYDLQAHPRTLILAPHGTKFVSPKTRSPLPISVQ
jgi:hypothetical protein